MPKRADIQGSNDFKTLNPHLHETNAGPELPHAEPERDQAPALVTAVPGKEKSLPRVQVRFIGYRVRPLDPDNFAGSCKDSLDFLRHSRLIRGDEPWNITLETWQVKVASFAEEKTVIEIDDGQP